MKKLISLCASGVAVALCAMQASAKEVVFNPTVQNADGSYSWTNVNNWVGGALPGINDVQVYQPSGDLTVMPDNLPSGYYSGYYQFGGMKFLSGNTYFKQNRYWYANATTTEVYVAEGATVVNSNVVDTWNADYALAKTGKGTFKFRKLGEGKAFKLVDVREGTLHNLTVNGASYVKASAVRIHGDALYYAQGYNYFVDNPDMQIDAGGKLRVRGGSGKVNVKCLTGEGEIFDQDYWTDLQIKPDKDCVFSGTMSAKVYPNIIASATGRFILGNANAVAACGQVKGCGWLSFLPGIGTFTLGVEYVGKSATSPIVLEDTNGVPVKAIAGVMSANAPTFAATGAGSVEFKTWNVALTNNLVRNTGMIRVHDGTMTLGHDSKADGFDFSKPSEISANSYTTVEFRNSGTVAFDGKVSGAGTFSFYPSLTTLGNYSPSGGSKATLYGDLTINGGDANCAFAGFTFGASDLTLTINGGRISQARSFSIDTQSTAGDGPLLPSGFVFGGGQSGTKVKVNGGEIWLTGDPGQAPQTLEQNGGRVFFHGVSYSPLTSATAENPCVVRFNGGTTFFSRRSTTYWTTYVPFADDEALALRVGEGGANFVGAHVYNGASNCEGADEVFDTISRPLVSDVESGVDGGVRQSGLITFRYAYPLQITGPYEAEGGATRIMATYDLSGGRYFGAGNTVLRNHRIDFADRTEPFSFCPHGAGKKLTVEGVAGLNLRKTSSGAAADVSINSLEIDHGVLMLMDPAAIGGEGASKVKLASAPATAANGRVLLPVIAASDYKTFDFVGYDAEKGFTNIVLAGSASFTNTDPTKLVRVNCPSGNWLAIPANAHLYAEALSIAPWLTISMSDNSTITIGDGVNPALLLLPSYGFTGSSSAALEFGTSEGVVVCGSASSGRIEDYWSRLMVPIRSANGLTIIGYPTIDIYGTIGVCMSATNTYSGATRINSAIVHATNDRCFSSGKVIVGGGKRYGGGVRFVKKGGVWTNDFQLAGWGIRKVKWSGWINFTGAMAFWRDGKVTGNVELLDDSRLCATNGAFGEIAGVISGPGKADIVYSRGVLRFSNSNTYTGGTDLISGSTLELSRGDSAGTGEVFLSSGKLRFVNDQPVVFANAVVGTGTVEVVGAPVTFTGDAFAAFGGRPLAKGSTITFPNIADSTARYAAVLDGGMLDLGGEDVTLHEVWGSGTIAGGTVTLAGEIHPGGEGAIGTLTFDRPPVVAAGATLVSECDGSVGDLLVVDGGDVALGSLALDFRLIGQRFSIPSMTLVSASDGLISGEFASVTKTPRRAESATVEYGASKAEMQFRQAMLIIFR